MSSNILFLPFRKTHTLALSGAIKQYISSKYDQHPDMFKHDLEVIDNLRRDAANVREPHVSGVKIITAYAAQLAWIGGKFPIDIGVEFTWYPALGYNTDRAMSQNNLKYELSNILYNLASLYSQLALASHRGSADGLKTACNYFCLAAGVISYIKTTIVPELRSTPAEDMDAATLESIQQLLLAQAQECFWQKAVMDGYKDASIAKLAARVSDLYSLAGDWGIKSEAISSEWIHHMTAKHHHFAAAAQYRQACDCLEKRKYGEEVARLKDSLLCVNEALKEARYINKVVLEDLTGLKNKVQDDLQRAEKDNDLIYLNSVPPKSELRILERANMAVAKVPKEVSDPSDFIGDNAAFGRPLFAQLVPFSVHVAASIYEERRDRLVNTKIIDELETLTTKIHDTLRSLNLPGSLQALEKPLGLPSSLLSHAEEIRQADALTRLQRSFADTAKLKVSDEAMLNDGRDILHAEAAEDNRLRIKYGTERWNRPDSQTAAASLYKQIGEVEGFMKSAANSDELVKTKYKDSEDMLRLLAGNDRDLGNFVPSSRRVTILPKLETESSRLRECLNDLSRVENRRRRKIESVREKAKRDDINSSILAEAARLERNNFVGSQVVPADFEAFFEQRLARYDADLDAVRAEEHDQEEMLSQVKSINASFTAAKRGDTSSKDREKALQQLENAYFKYKEIISNLEVGRKFYNDLSKIVGRFRDDCSSFSFSRSSEAAQLESDFNLPQMNNLTLQQQKQEEPRALRSISRSKEIPLPAPVPTRATVTSMMPQSPAGGMWNPEMGIKFGGPPVQQQNGQNPPPSGQWDSNSGVRFG